MMLHIPKIIIKPVQSENQRYPTCGDYIYDAEDDTMTVFISRMGDWRSEVAVAIHELFEACKCLADEVELTDIDQFDMNYERERDDGKHGEFDEPGDDKSAPYHEAHVGATSVEKEVCARLNIPWEEHDKNVNEA
jgi:hypothetical protein